ncbi:hypothetical protein [Pedobacter sp. SL55]|uniref:hypothetical protein n=1 Tax=Pedobacter sp. SL55 TaxID=2995161 RepID=UPI0022708DD0|nr:hypothetical protein [Pedobacter sp. SL55]WAC40391.1 hypothetical protein OVA16_17750 [Pedobacter sp. SL55]
MKRAFNYIMILVTLLSFGCTKNENKPCCEDIPLYYQMGAVPKMYNKMAVTPETQQAMSTEFKTKWDKAVADLELIGGRRLRSFDLNFISDNQLTITYSYTLTTGGLARAVVYYNYVVDNRGYLQISYASRDANGRVIAPGIFPIQEDYLERYKFRIDWIEDKIPGSTGKTAAYYKDGDATSYFYGSIIN